MRRCVFCGRTAEVVLWILDEVLDDPVPACCPCAEENGLGVVYRGREVGPLDEYESCRCCGRELPSSRSWPATVWVQDRRRLMAVCNACRVEYALQPVFGFAPPGGGRSRRRSRPSRDEPGAAETAPSD